MRFLPTIPVGFLIALVLGFSTALPARAVADPLLVDQWALPIVGAAAGWGLGGGEGVTIAVVDTGIDLDHEELGARIVADVSCVGADGDPEACSGSGQDDNGHGTHVAGIAAAAMGNGVGVAGVAPAAELQAVKVLTNDEDGGASGALSDVRAGIRWAVEHGADVVNLSLGPEISIFNLFGSGLDETIEDAWEAGVVVVAAAGNDSLFPTGYHRSDAVVVTATNPDDEQASYASDVANAKWGMAAPGGESPPQADMIISTWYDEGRDDAYGWAEGTSMATPFVTGTAAVLLSLDLHPQETVDRLLDTAVDLGATGRDYTYGHGRLDIAAAVDGLGSPDGESEEQPESRRRDRRRGSTTTAPATTAPPAPPPTLPPPPPPSVAVVEEDPGAAAEEADPSPPPSPTVPVPVEPERPPPGPESAAPAPLEAQDGAGAAPVVSVVGALLLAISGALWIVRRRARALAELRELDRLRG